MYEINARRIESAKNDPKTKLFKFILKSFNLNIIQFLDF